MAYSDDFLSPRDHCEICGVELEDEIVIQEFADGSLARLCPECAAGAAVSDGREPEEPIELPRQPRKRRLFSRGRGADAEADRFDDFEYDTSYDAPYDAPPAVPGGREDPDHGPAPGAVRADRMVAPPAAAAPVTTPPAEAPAAPVPADASTAPAASAAPATATAPATFGHLETPGDSDQDILDKTRELLMPVADLIALQGEMQSALERLATSLEQFTADMLTDSHGKTAVINNRLQALERELETTRSRLRETEALLPPVVAAQAVAETEALPLPEESAPATLDTLVAESRAAEAAAATPDEETAKKPSKRGLRRRAGKSREEVGSFALEEEPEEAAFAGLEHPDATPGPIADDEVFEPTPAAGVAPLDELETPAEQVVQDAETTAKTLWPEAEPPTGDEDDLTFEDFRVVKREADEREAAERDAAGWDAVESEPAGAEPAPADAAPPQKVTREPAPVAARPAAAEPEVVPWEHTLPTMAADAQITGTFAINEVQAAQRYYNESTFTGRIRDVRRSLGRPKASLVRVAGQDQQAVLTIFWDIVWYQYLIDLRRDLPTTAPRVVLNREGMDLDELAFHFREKNATVNDDGRLDASELEVRLLSDPSALITEMTPEVPEAAEDATEEIWEQRISPEFKWDD